MSDERAGTVRGLSSPLLAHRCSLLAVVLAVLLACSPEARRVRDGGRGADPDNKVLVAARPANPTAADTTLWPGKAEAPVDRLAEGRMAPPVPITAAVVSKPGPEKPITSRTPATAADQRSFDRGKGTNPRQADPRREQGSSDSARPRPPRE
jgi:hypothetical protein